MTDLAIEAGLRAWQAVSTATTFASWKAIAVAVAIGRQQALLVAGREKHLHRYLSEFDFRYSNRVALGVDDQDRTDGH
jgi:hypothetical protein